MIVDLDFQTPEIICKYMASLIPKLDKVDMDILEPTKGKGNLVEAIHVEMMRRENYLYEKGNIIKAKSCCKISILLAFYFSI